MASASTMRVFAVANQKGGVGKTTTTTSLGAALAEKGNRVLIVDLDPQETPQLDWASMVANLRSRYNDVLLNDTPMVDIVEPTGFNNLFVAPATLDLAGVEQELTSVISRNYDLRRPSPQWKATSTTFSSTVPHLWASSPLMPSRPPPIFWSRYRRSFMPLKV